MYALHNFLKQIIKINIAFHGIEKFVLQLITDEAYFMSAMKVTCFAFLVHILPLLTSIVIMRYVHIIMGGNDSQRRSLREKPLMYLVIESG